MQLLSAALILAGANQVTVSPDLSETKPEQHVIVKTSAPGMVRLEVDSQGVGTTCSVVDHLRGPFQSAGTLGRTDCKTDLFLDAGLYKVRLNSPAKANKRLRVKATPFPEQNRPLRRLTPGREDRVSVAEGTQASWWVHVEKRGHLSLRVTGRTVGKVALWRNGEWVEDLSFSSNTLTMKRGQPRHDWTLERTMEAGDYLMTAYGTAPREWSEGTPDDRVWVMRDAPAAPLDRQLSFEVPDRGWLRYELTRKESVFAALALDNKLTGDNVTMTLSDLAETKKDYDVGVQRSGGTNRCGVSKAQMIPTCSTERSSVRRHMLEISGPPGTRGEVLMARMASGWLEDGDVASSRDLTFKAPADGSYLLGTFDLPPDTDAAPLTCDAFALSSRNSSREAKIASDPLMVDWLKPLVRRFNYDGDETVRFQIQKVGYYQVETGGGRANRCELYKFNGKKRERLTESAEKAECKVKKFLSAGDYELRMHGGKRGIISLSVGQWGLTPKETTAGKTSCWMTGVELKRKRRYAVDHTRGPSKRRGLIARTLPLSLSEPLPIALGEGRGLKVPVSSGGPIVVRALQGAQFTCSLAGRRSRSREGVCSLAAGSGELSVETDDSAPLFVVISRPKPAASPPPLRAWNPRFEPVPSLLAGQARFFNFDRSETTSLVVDVKKAGLYDVTTTGLLSTECRMRTATAPNLWRDRSGGRGRNCLLQAYLRPGAYLLSVATHGQSRGRGGIVLRHKAPKQLPNLVAGQERFYEAEAGALYQTKLVVDKDERYRLRTSGQGVNLKCRLDDHDGWPLERVPASCDGYRNLAAGRYLWTEMPLTVESQRHVVLKADASRGTLSGGGPHAVELHQRYSVALHEDTGKDRFSFELLAPMTLGIELTGGMLGRLYRAGSSEVLEVVVPGGGGVTPALDEEDDEDYDEEGYDEEAYGEEEYGEGERSEPPPLAPSVPQVTPASLPGHKVKLKPGKYVLETQHRRADVGIQYAIQLHVAELAPGVARSLPVPSEITMIVPAAGFVRARTQGDIDVRCRVFDARGQLRLESDSHGDDWNCAFTEPLPAGEYRFVVEPEAQSTGSTWIEVSAPRERKAGVLKNNTRFSTELDVVVAAVPPASGDELIEVELTSEEPISCAITTPAGEVVAQTVDTQRCTHIIAGGQKASYLARVWTTQRPADVSVRVRRLSRRTGRGGSLARNAAMATEIDRPGRYQTGKAVRCHIGEAPGVLRDCAGEVSLPKGPVVFARYAIDGGGRVAMSERRWRLDDGEEERNRLSRAPTLMSSTSTRAGLHLYEVELPRGARAAPACVVSGGVSHQTQTRCFAATAPTRASVLSAWIAGEGDERVVLRGRVATPGAGAGAVNLGAADLLWAGAAATFKLPKESTRLELTLAAGDWAVWVDNAGKAAGLCPPEETMSSCQLRARGGSLHLVSASGRANGRARVRATESSREEQLTQLVTAHESFSPISGVVRARIPAGAAPRTVEVIGDEIKSCALLLNGGRRQSSCRTRLPANTRAVLEIEHGPGAVVALAYKRGWREVSRWTTHVPRKTPRVMGVGERVALKGRFAERRVVLKKAGVISARSASGVCALVQGRRVLATDGMGAGCDLARAVPPGEYRVMVRSFAGRPLSGALTWARSDLEKMGEGVHPEAWVSMGESRFFQFVVERGSEVGLGVRTEAETLSCTLRDGGGRQLGQGCQQFKKLKAGSYLFEVRAPDGTSPRRFSPVVLGLEGGEREVPEDVLKELFQRAGVSQ